jgi:integrase
MRPSEKFRMRVENLDFDNKRARNPYGKTEKSRRFVPMSERMAEVPAVRFAGRKEGWVFPPARSKSEHIEAIAKGLQALQTRAGISDSVVLNSARHTYGSHALASTGNLFAVAASFGARRCQVNGTVSTTRLEFIARCYQPKELRFAEVWSHSARRLKIAVLNDSVT